MSTIAAGINFYNDVAALRGLLECAVRYFDNIYAIDASPCGKHSDDGSMELFRSFGIDPPLVDLNRGFGAVRTKLIHDCGCDWCMILDADERFFPQMRVLDCHGKDRWTGANPPIHNTATERPDVIDQGAHVKNLIRNADLMAIRSTRRHWMDFSMKKPSQNWNEFPDHQLRIVRNLPEIHYNEALHEKLIDERTKMDPKYAEQDPLGGPFHDHFHVFFRLQTPGFKEARETNYQRLQRGEQMVAV